MMIATAEKMKKHSSFSSLTPTPTRFILEINAKTISQITARKKSKNCLNLLLKTFKYWVDSARYTVFYIKSSSTLSQPSWYKHNVVYIYISKNEWFPVAQ